LGASIRAEDLNIVTQTVETSPGQGFDLVVATSGLAGYSRIEEMLMLENVAQMIASGGVFIANGAASVTIPQEFEAVSVAEGITAYRRR
jgi:threonine dehydrogenase-like Zn-dependent dehydrogenase